MSLINEALKRARQLRQPPPPRAESTDASLQPAEQPAPSRRSSPFALGGSLVLASLAAWFLWSWWEQSGSTGSAPQAPPETRVAKASPPAPASQEPAEPEPEPVAAANPPAEEPAAQTTNVPAPTAEPNPEPPPAAPVSALPTTAEPSAEQPAQVPQAVPREVQPGKLEPETKLVALDPIPSPQPSRKVAFPALKLQGIYFRLKNPSALINNRTMYLGDEIEGARLVGIDRFLVIMEMHGQTNHYSLKGWE